MDIYLIRHTTPAIEKGICYGQTDLDVTETFADEVLRTKAHIPAQAATVFSSPLQRCRKLAEALFPQHDISFHDHLMELDCGDWEMQPWDDIPKDEIDPWMKDFVHVAVPNGESYTQLHERVVQCFEQLQQQPCPPPPGPPQRPADTRSKLGRSIQPTDSIRAALRATYPSLRAKPALGGAPTSRRPRNLPPRLRYQQC